jgi:hypothetical protein
MSEAPHQQEGERATGRGFDRRAALKRGAAAGAIVWAAPLVTTSPARAADGTCTPKCVPSASATVSAGAGSLSGLRCGYPLTVQITNQVCPCNPTAALGHTWGTGPTVDTGDIESVVATPNGTLTFLVRQLTGDTTSVITGQVTLTGCSDKAGDGCPRTYTYTINLTRPSSLFPPCQAPTTLTITLA